MKSWKVSVLILMAVLLVATQSPCAAETGVKVKPGLSHSEPARSGPDRVPPISEGEEAEDLVPPARVPRIDVAFCIDTTGSMQPYIDAVKKKVWDIANGILEGKPRPRVRMAVVAYRDRKDDYLIKAEPMTEDIDRIHTFLMELNADGGGDTPEHVTAGLRECVDNLRWTDEKKVLRLVYLIGDAPAQTGYDDGAYQPVAEKAAEKGINIHTIACAGGAEVPQWKEIARLSDGQFHQMPRAHMASIRKRHPKASTMYRTMAAPGSSVEASFGDSPEDMDADGAPASRKAAEAEMADELGGKILDSIKKEAERRGVASY